MVKRVGLHVAVMLLLVLALLLGACQSMNPFAHAKTSEQFALAAYGSFVIAEEVAADVFRGPATPAQVKRTLTEVDAVAKPVADSLRDSIVMYWDVRAQLAAGATEPEKLAIANDNMAEWTDRAMALTQRLQAAIDSAKGGVE